MNDIDYDFLSIAMQIHTSMHNDAMEQWRAVDRATPFANNKLPEHYTIEAVIETYAQLKNGLRNR